MILGQAQELVATGRIQTLEAWILSVPEPIRAHNPWLMFWLVSTKVSFGPDHAYVLFDQSLVEFRRQGIGRARYCPGAARSGQSSSGGSDLGGQRQERMAELARAIDVDPVAEPLYQ